MHDINGSVLFDFRMSLSAPLINYQLGLLVGRSGTTCATNFLVETAWDFKLVFSDKFDRADGPPGPSYLTVSAAPQPQIIDQSLCGTTQSVAICVNQVAPEATYRIVYDFAAATDEGFESYGIAAANATGLDFQVTTTGCDGGGAGCIPVVRQIPGDTLMAGLSPNLQPLATYKFVIGYQPGYATFRVYSADGSRLLTIIAYATKTPFKFEHLGVLVGRSGLSCIKNFEIYCH